jgi:hypothetical protein
MEKLEGKSREEIMAILSVIYETIDTDPKVWEEAEKFQKRLGTLSDRELRRTITI